jgi:hypothetical protein
MARLIKIASDMDSAFPWKKWDWQQETTVERPRTVRKIETLWDGELSTLTADELLVDTQRGT